MDVQIGQEEALELLRAYVERKGSMAKAAVDLGVSDGFLRDVLNGSRPVSDKLAQKLGYSRQVVYVKVKTS